MAGEVTRYHTWRTIRKQSIAEHSFNVAQIILHIDPNPRTRLITAALNHDLPEVHTGDMPAPIKRLDEVVKEALDTLEREFHRNYGTCWKELTEEEQHMLKFADTLDLIFWCLEEMQMGNRGIRSVLENGMAYMDENPLRHVRADTLRVFISKWYNELLCSKGEK